MLRKYSYSVSSIRAYTHVIGVIHTWSLSAPPSFYFHVIILPHNKTNSRDAFIKFLCARLIFFAGSIDAKILFKRATCCIVAEAFCRFNCIHQRRACENLYTVINFVTHILYLHRHTWCRRERKLLPSAWTKATLRYLVPLSITYYTFHLSVFFSFPYAYYHYRY